MNSENIGRVEFLWMPMATPPKTNMEPENARVEKEKHRPKPPIVRFQPSLFAGVLLGGET